MKFDPDAIGERLLRRFAGGTSRRGMLAKFGLTLVAAPEFAGVDTLFASARRGRVTVWGLSRTGQVICTSAPQVYVADPAAWSRPAVALSNVDAIAPCPDGDEADDAFFAHTAGGLIKVTRSPGNNLWISYSIVLPLRA